jgi:hypothetical protein
MHERAKAANLTFLNEVGLDPGCVLPPPLPPPLAAACRRSAARPFAGAVCLFAAIQRRRALGPPRHAVGSCHVPSLSTFAAPTASCCVLTIALRGTDNRNTGTENRNKGTDNRNKGTDNRNRVLIIAMRALIIAMRARLPPVPHLHRDCAQRLRPRRAFTAPNRPQVRPHERDERDQQGAARAQWGHTRPPRGAAPRRACQVYGVCVATQP